MGRLVEKQDENGELDELVEMIDLIMEQGSGSLTIDVDENGKDIKVSTYNSSDCGKKGACCQPTELDCEEVFED